MIFEDRPSVSADQVESVMKYNENSKFGENFKVADIKVTILQFKRDARSLVFQK